MANLKLREKDFKSISYPKGKTSALARDIMLRHYRKHDKLEVLQILKHILENPQLYTENVVLAPIANCFIKATTDLEPREEISLLENELPYRIFGRQHVADKAQEQMGVAMQLPVTIAGALMPDAHLGYGLPIGGVLATENVIIPYGVGVDIGCRMCLSIYDLPKSYIKEHRYQLKNVLHDNTRFGKKIFDDSIDHEILERKEFKEISFVKNLKDKAYRQLGSSGSGNHFVEFGIVNISENDELLQIPKGSYIGILSHSGSRGMGAMIANHYTQLAMEKCLLPKKAKNLAWLDLNTEAGIEYWLAMNLAGDYASACHHQIHFRLSKALGINSIARVENHHNFAWKEQLQNGKEVIVHRKGATPAGKNLLGIIPGSMTAPGFIVKGRGEASALNSASHGAGRAMSRTKAKQSFTKSGIRQYLKKCDVDLIGGGIDEAPMAYKDIHQVMASQKDLVDILGTFEPKIVRMDKD